MDNILDQAQLILAQEDLRNKIKEAKELYDGYNVMIKSCIEAKLRIMRQIEDMEKLL
jgi:hypothetical protein